MKQIRTWQGVQFHYCCKKSGGHCKGIWTRHAPKDCDPNYVKKIHKNRHQSNNKKRVSFEKHQDKDQEEKSSNKQKKQKIAQPMIIEAPDENDSDYV